MRAKPGAIDFHRVAGATSKVAWKFTMKVLTGSHGECKLACDEPWISGNQAGMSKQADRPDYEY